jgi:hypothetical protein
VYTVLRASHKIYDSKPRICWHNASKFSSISSWCIAFWMSQLLLRTSQCIFLGGQATETVATLPHHLLLGCPLFEYFFRKIIQYSNIFWPNIRILIFYLINHKNVNFQTIFPKKILKTLKNLIYYLLTLLSANQP